MNRPDPSAAPPSRASRADSLIDFPCSFPIKVMGHKTDGFVETISAIALRFDPAFDPTAIELRDSSTGKYLGITLTVRATSQQQLDDLYRALSGHPLVKVVL